VRLLLDEGFPSPPGFSISSIDATTEVVSLRDHDRRLVNARTPDWYLYLVAIEGGFDALVTRDWHQSEQPEELWVLARLELSIITWKRPLDDPIREWGQMLAYLPEMKRMIEDHGASILFLPSPRLNKNNLLTAKAALGELAKDLGISRRQLRDQARESIVSELMDRGETARFGSLLS